jgi:hypothetical protein
MKSDNDNSAHFIVVIDNSGSMGRYAAKFINETVPLVMTELNIENVHLVSFSNKSEYCGLLSKNKLKTFKLGAQGATYMAGTLEIVKDICDKNKDKDFRILVLSDGDVHDQQKTQEQAFKVSSLLKDKHLFNTQAVRLMTGNYGSPDTRALSSFLQLNNTTKATVVDIDAKLGCDSSNVIATLFDDDKLNCNYNLEISGNSSLIKKVPWEDGKQSLKCQVGKNVFWVTYVPNNIKVNGKVIKQEVTEEFIDQDMFYSILNDYIEKYINQAKVLSIINTSDSKNEISKMLNYFTKLEEMWSKQEYTLAPNSGTFGLKERLYRLKKNVDKNKKSVSQKLAQLANTDLISKLNSQQQANFLRELSVTNKNAKGLAKRANMSGLDFESIVKQEITSMHKNLHELNDVDDTNHLVSFVCLESTLGGIKAVTQLIDQDILENCNVMQILELFNINGIPVDAEIGEYPDPMTYRLKKMHFDSIASISDLIASNDVLLTPSKGKIVNVIPVFEDNRIILFLRKYAPKTLEYLYSVGMRRVIADVPMTVGYTMLAGIWFIFQELDQNKSEIKVKSLIWLIDQLHCTVGNYFSHIKDYLIKPKSDDLSSFDLTNNGVTNVMFPLYQCILENKTLDFPKIFRALFTFEIWQIVRKQYNHKENSQEIIANITKKLLCIDFDKHCIPLPAPFETVENKVIGCDFEFNLEFDKDYLVTLLKNVWFVDYISLLKDYFEIIANGVLSFDDKVTRLKSLPKMTTKSIETALDIPNLLEFKLSCVLQALYFTTKKSRIDEESGNSTLPEPGLDWKILARKMCVTEYFKDYDARNSKKHIDEKTLLNERLVKDLIHTQDIPVFVDLLQNGVKEKDSSHVITISSPEFNDFFECLKAHRKDCTRDDERTCLGLKLEILVTGKYKDLKNHRTNAVFNGGNVMRLKKIEIKEIFQEINQLETWSRIEDAVKNLWIYRKNGTLNRHFHSNENPSYWALGYSSIEEMKELISVGEWTDYCKNHTRCGCLRFL